MQGDGPGAGHVLIVIDKEKAGLLADLSEGRFQGHVAGLQGDGLRVAAGAGVEDGCQEQYCGELHDA